MRIRALDLFCGGGGSSWGASAFGADIACGVDAWDIATATFKDNFKTARAVNAELGFGSGRDIVGRIGSIDLLLASPECTNHTCARGSRARDESSRDTALYVLNFVRLFKPRWLIIENVVQMRAWSKYQELISELEQDYFLRPQVLDAANFGVPQTRRRLFIVGDREGMPPDLSGKVWKVAPDASSIIDSKGTWSSQPLYRPGRARGTLERAERAIAELGEGVPFFVVYYGTDGAGGWQRLDRPIRTLTTLDRFGLVEWTGSEPTLRMLQVPELKRAMGLPSSFVLQHGTRRDRIKLLGNGVCPPVITRILKATSQQQRLQDVAVAAD
jgi:DNA (cytosine-5)-methyltransferase 1